MLLSKCAVCDSKRQKFIKEQEASWLLGILGIKTPLIEILLVGPLLFQRYKMNEIVNNFYQQEINSTIYNKQRKNTKILKNRKFMIYLSKQTRQRFFSI